MQPSPAHNPIRPPMRHGRRRGVAAGLVLAAMVTLFACLALVVGIGRVWTVHIALRNVCESAALGAAAELLDDDRLRGQPNYGDDVQAAREQAARLALQHEVDGRPVALDLRSQDGDPGDVVVGWVGDPMRPGTRMTPWDGKFGPNSVSVRVRRSALRGDPVSMFFAEALGLIHSDVGATARASIDQRIIGFRPGVDTCAPLVPIVADSETWNTQAWMEAVAGSNDRYAFNPVTAEVMRGPDGIPEVELRAPLSSASQQSNVPLEALVAALIFPESAKDWTLQRWQQQLLQGLSRADLRDQGEQLVADPLAGPVVVSLPVLPAELPSMIWPIIGQARAWPMGVETAPSASGDSCWKLTGFAAGRLVDAYIESNDGAATMVIVVQPAMLATSTALVASDAAENPWIAKLEVTQ